MVPSAWADKANNDGSIDINDVTPVAASKPQKARNDHCHTPIKRPWAIPQSPVLSSKATTPPGKHVARPGEAPVVKEVVDGQFMVRTSKATMPPGKHVTCPGEALAVKEVADNHDNLHHGMAPL